MQPSNSLNLFGNNTPPNTGTPSLTPNNSFNLFGNLTPPSSTVNSIGNSINNQITPTTPINPANIQTSPASGGVVTAPSGGTTNPGAFVGSITPPPATGTTTQQGTTTGNDTSSEIDNLMKELGYKSNDVSQLQSSAGIPGLQNSIQDISTQLAQKKAMYEKSFQNIGGQNIPSVFVSGQLAMQRQAAAVDIGATAAQLQAAQGNLSSAFDTIKQTIDQKYNALEDSIKSKLQFYELNRDKFTPDQQKRADRLAVILGVDQNRAALEKANTTDAVSNIQEAIKNGTIDAAQGYKIMGDLVNGVISAGDAYAKAGIAKNTTGSGGEGNAVVDSTLKLIGTTGDQTVNEAINQVGLPKLIAGIVAQEGGTPQGTNNPGNIKFVGQPGATKGKAATDGGNFANFATPQDFQNAITKLITNNGNKNLSEFIAKYKGVTLDKNVPLYNGLKPATSTAVRGVVSSFKSEPQVTNFIAVQDGYNFAKSIPNNTTNPTDDQGLIYSLAKVLDPGSVVREGEYATVQKYAQSWVKAYGKKVEQAINGTGFLSPEARQNIKNTIETKYNSTKATYENLADSYAEQINNLTGSDNGSKFLREYSSTKPTTSTDRTAYAPAQGVTIPSNYVYNYNKDFQRAQELVNSGSDPAKIWGYFNALYK